MDNQLLKDLVSQRVREELAKLLPASQADPTSSSSAGLHAKLSYFLHHMMMINLILLPQKAFSRYL